ncbi:MAG: M23 family metallopeptidase [Leptospiraceae bacterium]|nr:M23 family metallopeptidase [Leptospiraceae bacterium]
MKFRNLFSIFIIILFSICGYNLLSDTTTPAINSPESAKPIDTNAKYPEYGWPIFGDKLVTGSFGEFRYYHFHMGQDFATEAKNGIPLLAMTDGKIIKLQSYRYSIGNAVILLHDDGFMSRYGHMSAFAENVWTSIQDKVVLDKKSRRQDFEYTLSQSEQIRVKKGDVIGYSGDTGIGPSHLHLEIFKDNVYYNPADFGLNYYAFGEINVYAVDIVPENNKSFINGKNSTLTVRFKLDKDKNLIPVKPEVLKIKGDVSLSVYGSESSGRSNKIGFQKITVSLNSTELQEINFSKISSFHTYRSCFVLDNYKSRMNGRPFKYFTHTKDGNTLLGFKNQQVGAGLIRSEDFKEGENEISLMLYGISPNPAIIRLNAIKDNADYPDGEEKKFNLKHDSYVSVATSDKKGEAFFPAYSIFTQANFSIDKSKITKIVNKDFTLESEIYTVEPDFREFNLGYDLYIKLDKEINKEKFGLYQIANNGKIMKHFPGVYFNTTEKFFRARIKATGNFAILSDNSKPTLRIYRHKNNHVFKGSDFKIYLIANDSGTGIPDSQLQAKVDDKEAYLDLDPETGLREIFYPDSMREVGKHTITVTAKDRANNEADPLTFSYEVK